MAQLFPKGSNLFSRLLILAVVSVALGVLGLGAMLFLSPYYNRVDEVQEQPVPFSHEHHVRGLGIDCRFCHTTVETTAFAGIPSTKTCMTCHSQIWTNADLLEPVRQAYQSGQPVQWTKLHNMPDFVYFNHSMHVAKGVACITCHGPVDRMPLMRVVKNMSMMWCLECHRNPAKFIQPKETVFQMASVAKPGQCLVDEYRVKGKIKMADCYTCHR